MPGNNQNIDGLIQGITSILKNRRSLSANEVKLLNECVELLERMKRKDSDPERSLHLSKALEILLQFFKGDIHDFFDKL